MDCNSSAATAEWKTPRKSEWVSPAQALNKYFGCSKYRSTQCSVHVPRVCRHQQCQGPCEGPVQFSGADLTDWDRAASVMDIPPSLPSWKLLSPVVFQVINCSSTMSAGPGFLPSSPGQYPGIQPGRRRLNDLIKMTFLKTHFSFTELATTRSFTLTLSQMWHRTLCLHQET